MLKWSGTPILWAWSALPSLPYAVSSMGVASIGTQIFVVGGADYDGQAFSVFTDRQGGNAGFGKHLLVLDLLNLSAGWQRGPDLPGSPRWVHSVTAVGGQARVCCFVLGFNALGLSDRPAFRHCCSNSARARFTDSLLSAIAALHERVLLTV